MSATFAEHSMLAASSSDNGESGRSVPIESALTQPPTRNRSDEPHAEPVEPVPETERLPFGRYLSRAREAKRLSLDDLAHQTKIRRAILEALEHSARRDLPEKVFVLGYVRSYAAAVGLNVEEAVNRCNADWEIDDHQAPSVEAATTARSWAWLWPTLAAMGFGGGIWFIVHLR
jgi:transcriptional regulator with XRE-family HTH domain